MKLALFATVLALSTAAFARPVVIQKIAFMGPNEKPALAKIIVDTDSSSSKLVIYDLASGKPRPVAVNESLDLPMEKNPSFAPKILTLNGKKALQINLGNEHLGIGRFVYSTKLTVAYRQSDYRLVGFTHTSIDKVNPNTFQSCDYNLLNGKGVKNGRTVRLISGASPISMVKIEEVTDCNSIR